LEADEFIGTKSFKAKGKRISTYQIDTINELEPLRFPEKEQKNEEAPKPIEIGEEDDEDTGKSSTDIADEILGQMKLFD
jgi:topoisomerase-4 subunit A